jgi:hypothetical protein
VRNLERELGALCRKVARRRAEGDDAAVSISPDLVVDFLGAPKFLDEEMEERTKRPGVVIGLAWTPAGGDVLFIEAQRMQGTRLAHPHRPARRRDEGVGCRYCVRGVRLAQPGGHRRRLVLVPDPRNPLSAVGSGRWDGACAGA